MEDREQLERRLANCDQVLREHSGSADPLAVERVAVALCDKARVLADLGRHGDSLELWEEALERYAEDPPAGEELIGLEAGYNKARELSALEHAEEALAAADEVLGRWEGRAGELSEADEVQRSRYLAATLLVKQRIFAQRHRADEALPIADELVSRYGESTDSYLAMAVAGALRSDVYWLLADGRVEEAVAASERLSERFRTAGERDALLQVGEALFETGLSLGLVISPEAGLRTRAIIGLTSVASALRVLERGRSLWPPTLMRQMTSRRRRLDQAQSIFSLIVERLRDYDDPELAHLRAHARTYLAAVRMMRGQWVLGLRTVDAAFKMGEPAARIFRGWADEAIAREGRAAASEAAMALFVLGTLYEEMGRRPMAAAAYTECIARFGDYPSLLVRAQVVLSRLSLRKV